MAFAVFAIGQVPQTFNYQAVLRDSDGTIMKNESVAVQIEIIQGNIDGTPVYTELHNTATTRLGFINIKIGTGTTTDDFSLIEWSQGPFFLGISINGLEMGVTQLLSVPYAIHAGTVDTIKEYDPLFTYWDKDYADLINTPITITQAQAEAIIANTGKDTTGIYHANRAAIDLVAGINTGDQDISVEDHSLSISAGSTIILPDEVNDNDSDPTNEIQDLVYLNDTLEISKGSSYILPSMPV